MTKEEVLQRANDYCNERSYDESTLTAEFKDKFADFFAKRNPEGDINDEAILSDLKFNIDTARSAALRGISFANKAFETKENDYKKQIAELTKPKEEQPTQTELPEDVKKQLQELEKFKDDAKKREKYKEVVDLAKKSVREDLHKSFEIYAADFAVNLDETTEEQAKRLSNRFQDIFRDSIGEIKPLAPRQTRKQDEEFIGSLPKIKI